MHITRHDPELSASFLQEQLDAYTQRLPKRLQSVRKRPNNFSLVYKSLLSHAAYLTLQEPQGDFKAVFSLLRQAALCIDSMFLLTFPPPSSSDLWIGEGEPFTHPQTGPTSSTHCGAWLQGFYLATICRERDIIDALCKVPLDTLRLSTTVSPEYAYEWIAALKAYFKGDETFPQHFERALELTGPGHIKDAEILNYVLYLEVPLMELLNCLVQRDAVAFNQSLEKALNLHKRYYSVATENGQPVKSDPRGFLAYGPLALACFARSLDIPVEVESDYIPKVLLEGRYA